MARVDDDPTSADAEWKKIQINTFTRWANHNLKDVNKYIYNLETDLSDGLILIALGEVLSGQMFTRFNRKPTFTPQKIENIGIFLKFVEDQNIKLVNIDASDILKGNIKIIVGLFWTLILKYSLSKWGEDDVSPTQENVTPKQYMLAWVQSKVADSFINNFTTDWNDGRALGAIVDSMAPGLCSEWDTWKPKDSVRNAKEAMDLAEQWLDIPQVITPEEISNPNVDELSVMTYLSAFRNAKVKAGAPLRPRTNASSSQAHTPVSE